jgi:Ca-activated chloride channel family protein
MLDFANPFFLLLILPLPLVIWRWLRRPIAALRYSDTRLLARLPSRDARLSMWVGAGLRGLVLLLIVVGLAGPRWPDRGSRIPTEGISIQMILDNSGSMAEPDFDWQGEPITRLEAAKRAFRLFVEGGRQPEIQALPGRPNDLIGLITFASWPESPCPLTLDHGALLHVLDTVRPRTLPTESRTNIGDAVAWGLHRMSSTRTGRKIIILLSDGEHNVPAPAFTPRQAAQLAANERVPIYAIEAAGPADSAKPETLEAGDRSAQVRQSATESMQAIAKMTGGKYFRASDSDSLLRIYEDIDHLERERIHSFFYRRYYEGYSLAGLAALAVYVAIRILETTLWLKTP